MKKLLALACCGVAILCGMTGCAEEESKENYTENDLPYGSTMEVNNTRDIPMQYDRRFLDEELLACLNDYYLAIEKNDASLFSPLMLEFYHNYEMNVVYGGELSDADLIDNTHKAYESMNDGAFAFSLVDVKSLYREDGSSESRDAMLNMLYQMAEDQEEKDFQENISAFYEMRIDRYLTDAGSGETGETDTVLADEILYAAKYQGQWYLIYS